MNITRRTCGCYTGMDRGMIEEYTSREETLQQDPNGEVAYVGKVVE